jgi:hypothetical protein
MPPPTSTRWPHAARRIREAAGRDGWRRGTSAGHVCEWIAILNDLVVLSAVDLAEAEFDLPLVPWCWLAFGSEGRLEQTLDTDQDNGLVFVPESEAGRRDPAPALPALRTAGECAARRLRLSPCARAK